MNQTLRILMLVFVVLPILPIAAAIYQHSWHPLGYLVWFIFGSLASTAAQMATEAKRKQEKLEEPCDGTCSSIFGVCNGEHKKGVHYEKSSRDN